MTGAQDRGGFTLVELIIALGIIAVLAAIAVPVYANATSLAGQAVLKANARDVKLKLTSFILDGLDTTYRADSQDPSVGATSAQGFVGIALTNALSDHAAVGNPEAISNPISGSGDVVNAPYHPRRLWHAAGRLHHRWRPL
jgi:prepilin-type N-terminal cleavage/methylation domain-containing protein